VHRWWLSVPASLLVIGLSRVARLEVEGESMLPTLAPGDRVLVWRTHRARVGDIVLVQDPRDGRLLIKRVKGLRARDVFVEGDNPAHSTDSRSFGWLPSARIRGRALWRYWPSERAGRLGA
jgi:nickel-type superoxide dismutase maturation protease